ncbi:AAA family ATPase [Mesorhizobium sp.]|uniref:AAA family ATPase n=1 Tax=Mesorhizobium sp. TaxID=1871066 RepID=UPI000FE732EF|nr:AAA family ATPase [Mesorhizobium sp.]RWP32890.1 MAG: adenylate cyclase [Mesorhizobium sp.]RWP68040.1 MAG: adenylate cyclase [Mesorhizobium sp.]
MDIEEWLRSLGLQQYGTAFRENNVEAEVLLRLTAEDLKDIGVSSVGHRRKLLEAIAELRESSSAISAEGVKALTQVAELASAPASPTGAERRQLTVMFADLVGSTAISARVDPEEMSEIIRGYQNCCAGEITRFEGHIAKFMGDGVLAYFGWPRAHEDDAERAVRAGLAVASSVAQLRAPDGKPLAGRVGIATGLVVVGELVGDKEARERAVVGETPTLASRLQDLARPGSVIVAESTRHLLGDLFELEDLGPQVLKGFETALKAYSVRGEGRAESRFEAFHTGALTKLVGREQELALLLERWSRAEEGEGQVILLSGEPGIGKSRIVRALREHLANESYIPLSNYCSPYHTNSALYPVVGLLERAAHFDRDDTAEMKLDKLETLLARGGEQDREAAQVLAALLAIPTETRYPPIDLPPQRIKQRTLEILVEQLAGLAKQKPVLAVYEDVHWIDPSTLELLGLVIERVQRLPALVLITFRPEFSPPGTSHAHVTQLSLSRLTRRHGAAVALRVTGGKALPREVLDQIMARTDGVPLFVEELTKTVLESGLLRDVGNHFELTGTLPPLAIPATLHDSLMARLDHLAPVKEVAQIGAVIGREFSHDLLAAVAPHDEGKLQDALAQLCRSELIYCRGAPPEATYSFKHALVQDAAYSSLLKTRRQQMHARIAAALEERVAAGSEALPEIIAHHCTEAGLIERAVSYWWQAAQSAIQRSAILESIAHLENGLRLVRTLPDTQERVRLELDMQVALGTAFMAAKGWSSPATAAAFARAEELCERVDDITLRSVADYGRYLVYLLRGQLDAALATTTSMLRRAECDCDRATIMIAHRCVGITSVHRGDFDAGRKHMEASLALYDPNEHAALAYRFAYDPRIANLCYIAHALLHLGYPDQAFEKYTELLQAIRHHRHSPSAAFGLFQSALFCTYSRDLAAYKRDSNFGADEAIVDELISISTEHGFSLWRTAGVILKGWVLIQAGESDSGLAQMRDGIVEWRGHDAKLFVPRWLLMLASALSRLGNPRAALDRIEEGLALITETNERWNETELHLRKGELLLDLKADERAEASFLHALTVAQHQRAKLWELRAATSLARLWVQGNERQRAHDLLAPVCGWFTEGFATPDIKEARTFLDLVES